MKLETWIVKTGPKKAAQILDVDTSTISRWKTGRSLPPAKVMFKIHKVTKGKVTYKEMIEPKLKK